MHYLMNAYMALNMLFTRVLGMFIRMIMVIQIQITIQNTFLFSLAIWVTHCRFEIMLEIFHLVKIIFQSSQKF